jgi:acyl-CoA reductase-like NAD-dependent aldehyde dehydrogenase
MFTRSVQAGDIADVFFESPDVRVINDEIHAPMGGVRDSGWGRTGPESLNDFTDVIWINAHGDQHQYPF